VFELQLLLSSRSASPGRELVLDHREERRSCRRDGRPSSQRL